MNFLLDGLPTSVRIGGRDVPIETSHRAWLRFEGILEAHGVASKARLDEALGLYYPPGSVRPGELQEAVDGLIWFFRCGASGPPKQAAPGAAAGPAYSYEHDAGYIYAAFMQAYGIDLTKTILHWWQFRALFLALPEDTAMMKIIGYRTAKVPKGASAEQRQRIETLKRVYALPLSADQQKLTTDLEAILMQGGDPTALLEQGVEGSWHTMEL